MDARIKQYLQSIPGERHNLVRTLRTLILDNMPEGLVEQFDFGMLTYVIPLEEYPNTYNKKPLMHCALANQKNYVSLYLMGIYGKPELKAAFEQDYRATGKRYDVGASCVRFCSLDDVPGEVLGSAIAAVSKADLVAMHDGMKSLRKSRSGQS